MAALLRPAAELIPDELKQLDAWGCWRSEKQAGKDKPAKVPIHYRTGQKRKGAFSRDAWGDFGTAWTTYEVNNLSGVGVLVPACDGLVFVDIDNAFTNRDKQILKTNVADIVDSLGPGYWEISPSGNGLRGVYYGSLLGVAPVNAPLQDDARIELYGNTSTETAAGRYVTITGVPLEHVSRGTVTRVNQVTLDELYETYRPLSLTAEVNYPDEPPVVSIDAYYQKFDAITESLSPTYQNYVGNGFVLEHVEHADHSRSGYLLGLWAEIINAGWLDDDTLVTHQDKQDGVTNDAVIFSYAVLEPHVMALAQAKRKDNESAMTYLWRDWCRCKAKLLNQVDAFDELEGSDIIESEYPRNTPNSVDTVDSADLVAPEVPETLFVPDDVSVEASPGKAPDWVVRDWIPRKEVTLLYGPTSIGKTFLVTQLAYCVAEGRKWLDLETEQGGVLGLFMEEDANLMNYRNELVRAGMGMFNPSRNFHTLGGKGRRDVDYLMTRTREGLVTTKFFRQVAAEVERLNPKLVILDNIGRLFGGSENDKAEVGQFMNKLVNLATRTDCAIVLLGHPSRTASRTGDGTGATSWGAIARSRIEFRWGRPAGRGANTEPNGELENVRYLQLHDANLRSPDAPTKYTVVPSDAGGVQYLNADLEGTGQDILAESESYNLSVVSSAVVGLLQEGVELTTYNRGWSRRQYVVDRVRSWCMTEAIDRVPDSQSILDAVHQMVEDGVLQRNNRDARTGRFVPEESGQWLVLQ